MGAGFFRRWTKTFSYFAGAITFVNGLNAAVSDVQLYKERQYSSCYTVFLFILLGLRYFP